MLFLRSELFIEWPKNRDDRSELDLMLSGLTDLQQKMFRYELRMGWAIFTDDITELDSVKDYVLTRAMDLADGFNANYYRNVLVSACE